MSVLAGGRTRRRAASKRRVKRLERQEAVCITRLNCSTCLAVSNDYSATQEALQVGVENRVL
jgi:hypothetical protein